MAVHKFGPELLNKYWEVEAALLPGRAADSILVLLKHWRRVIGSPASCSLEKGWWGIRHQEAEEVSDVTMASDGFPAMLATSSASETEGGSDGEASEASAAHSSPLLGSPPPLTKAMWREKAGKPVKKMPAGKTKEEKELVKKKPAAKKQTAAKEDKKPSEAGLGPDTLIAQETLSIGGDKNQSYIQHMPFSPNAKKKLVVSVSLAQAAKLKVSHKQPVEELLPACKKAQYWLPGWSCFKNIRRHDCFKNMRRHGVDGLAKGCSLE